MGLANRMHHKPSEALRRSQRRVAIARALSTTTLILADEPTGNLDSTREIMNILKGLHKEGRSIVLITHDRDIASMTSRQLTIRDGRIEHDSAAGGAS